MEIFLLLFGSMAAYVLAYHTYGKFLSKKIFSINDKNSVPSIEKQDGIDFVPTKKGIIFGHHYTSIAGTGPIVGPAIGIIWGWLPALLWVLLGSIFMGAVHDFGSLVISLRNDGKSVSEIAGKYINPRVRFIFFCVVFLTLLIVIAIFGVVIAAVFSAFPSSVIPVWLQIPISIALGRAIYIKKRNVLISTVVATITMYLTIILGSKVPFVMPKILSIPPIGVWVAILLVYAWIASTLSVTTLLQPRDYINAWQLFIAMGLIVVGIIVSTFTGALELVAPAINHNLPPETPSIWPYMFVLIACGAISGFHSLVASGTSPKQLEKESDALFIGYGSMLLESFLAILVIICVGAGIGISLNVDSKILTGAAAWQHQYAHYFGNQPLSHKLAPVVVGAANMMKSFGIPFAIGTTLMGVFIASFASTTLDTAVRLQRYVVGEVAGDLGLPKLTNRWSATTLAVLSAAALAFATGASGVGALKLWPLFGSANQLLAALALLVISLYLKRKGKKKYLVTMAPCIFMLVVTGWAIIKNQISFTTQQNFLLMSINGLILLLTIWMLIESLVVFMKK